MEQWTFHLGFIPWGRTPCTPLKILKYRVSQARGQPGVRPGGSGQGSGQGGSGQRSGKGSGGGAILLLQMT